MEFNATLIGQAITFAILVWFTMKFVWPPLVKALDERAERIAEGLSAADRAKNDLALAEKGSAEKLREARLQAAELLAQAEKRAAQVIDEAKAAARDEGDRLIAGAKAEIDQELNRAKEGLREQVAELAVAGAERILRREIDRAAHAVLLVDLKSEL